MAECDMQSHKGNVCVCSGCPERETPGQAECDVCIICAGPHMTCCLLLEGNNATQQQESPLIPVHISTRGDGVCKGRFYAGQPCVCFGCIYAPRCEHNSGCESCSGPPAGCRSARY